MGLLDVGIGQLAVVPRHLQGRMTEEALQDEDVTAVAKEHDGRAVSQGVL